MPSNPRKLGLGKLCVAPFLLEPAEAEADTDAAVVVPVAVWGELEALEEIWLGYNEPKGLISNCWELM